MSLEKNRRIEKYKTNKKNTKPKKSNNS